MSQKTKIAKYRSKTHVYPLKPTKYNMPPSPLPHPLQLQHIQRIGP
jgi:hypothetical protein